jgi:hypothetical protein
MTDAPNLVGLGIGAVLLLLVFRTLWRQEDGWRNVLEAARQDAAAARADAAAARADAAAARAAESECRRQLTELGLRLAAVEARLARYETPTITPEEKS